MTVFQSLFDIIGPIMVGPSSSHTAGAVRIGLAARSIFGQRPDRVTLTLYGSFAHTYKGHGTDLALIAGLLGCSTESEKIPHAYLLAEQEGMEIKILTSEDLTDHPNTCHLFLEKGDKSLSVTAISTGGGMIDLTEIDGFDVHVSCEEPVILVFHRDRPGLVAQVSRILAREEVNISQMEVSRKGKGDKALMLLATDGPIPQGALEEIQAIADVSRIIFLTALKREGVPKASG